MHHPHVNCSIIHKSQVWKQPKYSWINEQIHYMCRYTYNGIVSQKEKWNLISYNVDGPWGYYAKCSKLDMISLLCGIQKAKQMNIYNKTERPINTESNRWLSEGLRRGVGGKWNRWGRLRDTNFQVQNKWVTEIKFKYGEYTQYCNISVWWSMVTRITVVSIL